MIHQMGLYGQYFQSIIQGEKKVEVRLNDEKRRLINVGDIIEFIRVPEMDESIKVSVTNLRVFPTFKEMYETIPFADFGCEGWTMEEMLAGTQLIYSSEQELKWGTAAITIQYIG